MSATSTSKKNPGQLVLGRYEQILRQTPKKERANIIKGLNLRAKAVTDPSRKSEIAELVKKAPYFPEPSAQVLSRKESAIRQRKSKVDLDSHPKISGRMTSEDLFKLRTDLGKLKLSRT